MATVTSNGFQALICGGGIAAAEGLLRLRRLAGDDLAITMVAPNDELAYRPAAVREPFAFGRPRRYKLRRIADHAGAELVKDAMSWVDPDAQVLHTRDGQELSYDGLLIAIGAVGHAAYEHAGLFRDAEADETYQGIVQDIEDGYTKHVALLLPEGPTWPLPIYELALMTARRAREMGFDDVTVCVVTPEPAPLAAFGAAATEALRPLLGEAGVVVYPAARAEVPKARHVIVQPQGVQLEDTRIVAMPRLSGPAIRGLPGGDPDGFIPIDEHCRVPDRGGRIFAAGDAAGFPVKHGGIGAQQADVGAAGIAALAGADVNQEKLDPVIRGMLLTGGEPLYLTARIVGGESFESEVSREPQWSPVDKVVAEELGPYLAALDERH